MNDVCGFAAAAAPARPDAFRYDEQDRFPIDAAAGGVDDAPALGLVAAEDGEASRSARRGGDRAPARDRHRPRSGERAAAPRRPRRHRDPVPLARRPPRVRARARGRGRAGVRLQGPRLLRRRRDQGRGRHHPPPGRAGLRPARRGVPALAPGAAVGPGPGASRTRSRGCDHGAGSRRPRRRHSIPPMRLRLRQARAWLAEWLPLIDRVPPADVLDHVLATSGYADVLAGVRLEQARENVKKLRALARRVGNRGYADDGPPRRPHRSAGDRRRGPRRARHRATRST